MREIVPELQARLKLGATQLCRCWLVRMSDGTRMGFTDHDCDLEFDEHSFKARSGLDASAIESAPGLNVDNAQALGALSDASLREEDIRTGRFDRARIDHWLVDWIRPELRVLLFRGEFGEIRRSDSAFEVELRGLTERLNMPVGRSILRRCDRVLGDPKCRVDLGLPRYWTEGTVREASDGLRIEAIGFGGFSVNWFADGSLTWLSGESAGLRCRIKHDAAASDDARSLVLWERLSAAVKAGDRFRAVAGCDKGAGTCRAKFRNFANFRGFPHIPGEDWVAAYPKAGEVHDGASQQ